MHGLMQTSFFFGYNAIVCFAFFLMLGSVGWRASLLFVRSIYKVSATCLPAMAAAVRWLRIHGYLSIAGMLLAHMWARQLPCVNALSFIPSFCICYALTSCTAVVCLVAGYQVRIRSGFACEEELFSTEDSSCCGLQRSQLYAAVKQPAQHTGCNCGR